MAKTEQEHRQDILDVGKLIYQKGWTAANDGNISVRLDDRRILCTCTGVSKGMMTPADVIVCDLAGNKIDGARERTTWTKGIRIGSAKDGKVVAFIKDMEFSRPEHSGAEGLGVDSEGNVYGAVVRRKMLEKHIKSSQ